MTDTINDRNLRDLRDALYLFDNDQAPLAEGFLNDLIRERDEAKATLQTIFKETKGYDKQAHSLNCNLVEYRTLTGKAGGVCTCHIGTFIKINALAEETS